VLTVSKALCIEGAGEMREPKPSGGRRPSPEGVFKMTRDQALEACVRAMLRRKNYSEDMWQDSPDQKNIADNIITALEVLGLWRLT